MTFVKGQQHLARAKFHAPNGVEYGESMYDGRMQAQRRCRITENPEGEAPAGVEVIMVGEPQKERGDSDVSEKKASTAAADAEDENDNTSADAENIADVRKSEDKYAEKVKVDQKVKAKDPIRMFGFLTPDALKKAQVDAIQIVEKAIPELCRVNAEMLEVEIKIRRARKYRAKAEEKERKEMGEKEKVPNVAGLSIEA